MFNWIKSSMRIQFSKKSSLSKYEKKSIISEFSSLIEINQEIVTDENQEAAGASAKRVLRSALKKQKSNNENGSENVENGSENVEKVTKKVTFLLDKEHMKKRCKKSKLSKRSSKMQTNSDGESDISNETNLENLEEVVGACKRRIQTVRSKSKLSSPPISKCPSLDSLEFLEDDIKFKGFDYGNEPKENGTLLDGILKISSKNNKIMGYIYNKVKTLSKPSTSRTESEGGKSQQSEEIEMVTLIANDHNDNDTIVDDEFIEHIERGESQNPADTTIESTVGKLLFGVNLNHQATLDDVYDLCQKEKCSFESKKKLI